MEVSKEQLNFDILMERITNALHSAKLAVEADTKADYANAILNYKDAIKILESDVINAPEENQQSMFDLAQHYSARIELLEQAIPTLSGLTKINPASPMSHHLSPSQPLNYTFNEWKEEHPTGFVPEPPPLSSIGRCYWLMRVIAKTIQTGGYLTPQIYIPKSLWFQLGGKISNINTKSASFTAINETLVRLRDHNILNQPQEVIGKEIEAFYAQLVQIQNSLSKVVSGVQEVKSSSDKDHSRETLGYLGNAFNKAKRMTGAVAKGVGIKKEKYDDVPSYVVLVSETFENAQFLEKWTQYFTSNNPTSHNTVLLKKISDFFFSVLCMFVVRDLNGLIERYMKKTREALNKTK